VSLDQPPGLGEIGSGRISSIRRHSEEPGTAQVNVR